MAENMGLDKVEEEKEVTDEIDHLKIFSEEQRKKKRKKLKNI